MVNSVSTREPRAIDTRVARARAGDEQAFTELYDEYAARVYRYLLARVREPADAADLLQRVFLNVMESLPAFPDRGLPLGAWLFRIAPNAAIDFERGIRLTAPLEDLLGRPDDAPGPARIAEQSAVRARIHQALDLLTEQQRDVVVYRFSAGFSPAEIGRLMGKREGSVRVLQFRALQTLGRLGREAFDLLFRLTDETLVPSGQTASRGAT